MTAQDITAAELRELWALAMAAGPNRWVEVWEGWVLKDRDDIAHINAFNPATALRLINAYEAMAGQVTEARKVIAETLPSPPPVQGDEKDVQFQAGV